MNGFLMCLESCLLQLPPRERDILKWKALGYSRTRRSVP